MGDADFTSPLQVRMRVRSKCEFLALEANTAHSGVACVAKPLYGCEMLSLQPAAAGSSAADVGDVDGFLGQAGEAKGDA